MKSLGMMCRSQRWARYAVALMAVALSALVTTEAQAGKLYAIDPYHGGPRKIPDVNGQPGDSVTLADSQLIDILILAEGFLDTDTLLFINSDSSWSARGWYATVFGYNNEPGLRPFNMFKQAFRVWGLFEASAERVSTNRGSHYRARITDDSVGQIAKGNWWLAATEADEGFRDSLFASIDEIADSLNLDTYPTGVDNYPSAEYDLIYRRLYIVILALADTAGAPDAGDYYRPSGRSFPTPRDIANPTPIQVKTGIGRGEVHEFGHTFGYIRDEYIQPRGQTATETNPTTLSLWNIHNITFSNARCDLPWKHLAPGSAHNPKIRSLIGNLWMGSNWGELGNWHSEYKCQINGTADNYTCDFRSDPIYLRDEAHYCFWCEEIMTTRILERTGEFQRLDPGVGDFNQRGVQWWSFWDGTLRDKFYALYDYDSLIEQKNRCYELYSASNTCDGCETGCNIDSLPPCLPGCDIREIGNAIYTDPLGLAAGTGRKDDPIPTLSAGIAQAQLDCAETPIVVVRQGVQAGPITISTPVFLMTDDCVSVILGE